MPEGPFDLILCRNLVLTYLDSRAQRGVLLRLAERLAAGGAFVIGRHERLPALAPFAPWHPDLGIFRRRTSPEQTEAR
jgi:chemotaxis protein methyltransferase CheR